MNDQYDELEVKRQREITSLQETVDTCNQIVSEYENENKALKNEILQLRGKVMSLNITIQSYKDREKKPIIFEGLEKDLYAGEQKDLILSILDEKLGNTDKYSRSNHIITSIINANPEVGRRKEIKRKLSDAFKDFDGWHMNKSQKDTLRDLGIEIEYTNNHMKVIFYDDDRYNMSISRTPSDNRAGLNAAACIQKIVF